MVKLTKRNFFKFKRTFLITLLRVFLSLINSVSLQHNFKTNISLVDYRLDIDSNNIEFLLLILRNSMLFNYSQLVELTATDNLIRSPSLNSKRFLVSYVLSNVTTTSRLFLNVNCNLGLKTSSLIYANGDWLEREIYDLFGIDFYGHKNLIRILNDYGFQGYPLRKNFPLTGFVEINYDEIAKGVRYNPIIFLQESKNFIFDSCLEQDFGLEKDLLVFNNLEYNNE